MTPRWRRDGRELYYIDGRNRVVAVTVVPGERLNPSQPKVLFEAGATNEFDVTADGQRFLINAPAGATGQAPFNVILNWTSTLKK